MHRHFLQKIAYVSVLGGFAAVLGSGSALAEGFKMGKFLVQPKIEVREFYNDNLYTKQTGEESDFITHVKPSVTLNSQFDKNALNAGASLNGGKYLSDDENDFVDGNVYINGRYDGPQNLKALIGAGYTRGHEDRGSSSNLSGEEPLVFDVRTVSAGLIKRAAKVSARVDLKYDIYGYNNVSRKGLSDTDNGDRDRAEFYPSVRLGYTLTPNYELFFRGSYNTWNYDDTLDRNSKKKDADGYDAVVGLGMGFPGKFSGEVGVGYMNQSFDETTFNDVSGLKASASLEYLPSSRTVVRLNGSRSVVVSSEPNASSIIATSVGGYVDFHISRKLIVRPEASYTILDYQQVTKKDRLSTVGLGAVYSFSDRYYGGLSYKFNHRNGQTVNTDYSQSVGMARLGAKF